MNTMFWKWSSEPILSGLRANLWMINFGGQEVKSQELKFQGHRRQK